MAKRGRREFVQVLRRWRCSARGRGGRRQRGIARGVIGFDAVSICCAVPDRAPAAAARPDGLPICRGLPMAMTSAKAYLGPSDRASS